MAHTVGRTWTTDAVYRETRARTDRRRAEGCLTVEMEASALIAVARFRGVAFSQVLFAGDSLAGEAVGPPPLDDGAGGAAGAGRGRRRGQGPVTSVRSIERSTGASGWK